MPASTWYGRPSDLLLDKYRKMKFISCSFPNTACRTVVFCFYEIYLKTSAWKIGGLHFGFDNSYNELGPEFSIRLVVSDYRRYMKDVETSLRTAPPTCRSYANLYRFGKNDRCSQKDITQVLPALKEIADTIQFSARKWRLPKGTNCREIYVHEMISRR